MNDMKQVNARCSLLLCLASSEVMVDSLSHDILNAEEVDELMKEQTILSRVGRFKENLQH